MIAFHSAEVAVHFALHTQVALHQAEWTETLVGAPPPIEAALMVAREMGDRRIEGCFTGTLGEVAAKERQMARAERLLREKGDIYELGHIERIGTYPERGRTCLQQAEELAAPLGVAARSPPHQAIMELRSALENFS